MAGRDGTMCKASQHGGHLRRELLWIEHASSTDDSSGPMPSSCHSYSVRHDNSHSISFTSLSSAVFVLSSVRRLSSPPKSPRSYIQASPDTHIAISVV